jgi:uncharacterized membrane protein YhaH (DUF805 family)
VNQIDIQQLIYSFGLNAVFVMLLAFGLYYRRHHDRDLAVAIAVLNLTLFSLSGALANYTLSLGVGVTLFGVIRIVRLRTKESGWTEMAYLLVGLTAGLILGLPGFSLLQKAIYALIMLTSTFLLDNHRIFSSRMGRRINLTLEGTNIDTATLKESVEKLLGRPVEAIVVKNVTEVPPATKVEVRYREQKTDAKA